MHKYSIAAVLLAAGMLLAANVWSQQTPAATTPTAPVATTPKAPAKKATTTATKSAEAPALKTRKEKFSYALGMNIGDNLANLKKQSMEFDPNLVAQGLKDILAGGKTRLTVQEAQAVLKEVQQAKIQEMAAKNKSEGEKFLATNKAKEGVVALPSGLQYKIVNAGSGPKPTAADTVVCNYRGTLIDGTEFDSSYKRGQPATFPVGGVIKGWTEALQLMPVGSKWQLYIPGDLAYGEQGMPRGGIEPNSTLIFDVELISIQAKAKEPDKAREEKQEEKK